MSAKKVQKDTNKNKNVNLWAKYSITQEINISNIEKIKEEIDFILKSKNELVIKAENISNIDLTGVQLFLALKRLASDNAKVVSFDLTFCQESKDLINKAGFDLENILK